MGNSQSSDEPRSSSVSSTPSRKDRGSERDRDSPQVRPGTNGRKTHAHAPPQPQSHVTTAASRHTPPTAALVPSSSTASTSTSNAHAQANISASPASSHTRARSITTSGTPRSRAEDSASRSPMGNTESREKRPPSRSNTLPPPATEKPTEKPAPSPSSKPVDVPQPPAHDGFDDLEPPMNSPMYGLPAADFSRPPRLPLAIERDPEPTSPLITPQDVSTPMEQVDEEGMGTRRASMLSSTTLDDDEVADIETFALESDPFAQKVMTTLQYKGEARTVFVTGTFAKWEKKFRMQRGQDEDGNMVFTLTAALPAGTHHIRFLVDGEMIVTDQYLQTVDFTNSLVNYIEIAATTPPAQETQQPAPAEPLPIPGKHEAGPTGDGATQPVDIPSQEQAAETQGEQPSTLQDTVVPAPGSHDQPSKPIPIRTSETRQPPQHPEEQTEPDQQKPKKQYLPRAKYTTEIPSLLLHLDLYSNPEDERFKRANKASANLPQPPTLPMFMSKSILNATTPHKDDASVLTMPNHTVLNHLATSSIKNGVLATSGTTRYKKKFLTTIMFKPTSDEG